MKTPKSKQTGNGRKRPVGFRLDAKLEGELRKLAESDDRDLSYVIRKLIEIGLPIFKEKHGTV